MFVNKFFIDTWNREKKSGYSLKQSAGKYNNRPFKIRKNILNLIRNHIKSFPSRNNPYDLEDSSRVYLSQDLNIKKIFEIIKDKHTSRKVFYDEYREIFILDKYKPRCFDFHKKKYVNTFKYV